MVVVVSLLVVAVDLVVGIVGFVVVGLVVVDVGLVVGGVLFKFVLMVDVVTVLLAFVVNFEIVVVVVVEVDKICVCGVVKFSLSGFFSLFSSGGIGGSCFSCNCC